MNMRLIKDFLTMLPILSMCFVPFSKAEARAFNLDCAALPGGLSLQELLDTRGLPGDTLNLTGTCNERITINVDRITLDGGGDATGAGSAVIDGTSLAFNGGLVRVQANDVAIRGFTIQNSPEHGIQVRRSNSAVITNNLIRNNTRHGVQIVGGSFGRVGSSSNNHQIPGAPASEGNTIVDNIEHGILIGVSSGAHIYHNIISGNERGVVALTASGANIDGNQITGNNNRGVHFLLGASVRLSDSSNHYRSNPGIVENNLIEGNNVGILCELGGSAFGNLQNFGTGNITNFSEDGTCAVHPVIHTP